MRGTCTSMHYRVARGVLQSTEECQAKRRHTGCPTTNSPTDSYLDRALPTTWKWPRVDRGARPKPTTRFSEIHRPIRKCLGPQIQGERLARSMQS